MQNLHELKLCVLGCSYKLTSVEVVCHQTLTFPVCHIFSSSV